MPKRKSKPKPKSNMVSIKLNPYEVSSQEPGSKRKKPLGLFRKKQQAKRFAESVRKGEVGIARPGSRITTRKVKRAVARNPIGPLATLTQGKAKAQVYKKLKGYEVRITQGGHSKSYLAPKFKSAMAIGRLRLASQNPLGADDLFSLIPGYSTADRLTSKAFQPSRKRSKNPMGAASKVYEEFHGVPSEEVLEYVEEHHRHSVTAGIGKLVSMKLTSVDGAKFEIHAPDPDGKLADVVQVTVSEDGRQLFLIGGDQSLKLKDLGMKDQDERDHMLIGTITELTYRTQKTFEDKGREVDFFHKFGNEGSKGVCPILLYNPRSKSMKIAGGRYSIAAPAKSLGNVSPGIVG